MTTSILVGILAAFIAVTLAAGVRRAPTRARCPRCGTATEVVQLPLVLRSAAPELRGRWCPGCSWEGLGRDGGEMIPGQPVAHGSGFNWGEERLPPDFGFRFAARPEANEGSDSPPPPAHPSGFRFGDEQGASEPPEAPRVVAFRWKDAASQPAFQWRESARRRIPPFRWKE